MIVIAKNVMIVANAQDILSEDTVELTIKICE